MRLKALICMGCGGTTWTVRGVFMKDDKPHLMLDCTGEPPKCNGWRHTIRLSHWPQTENTGPVKMEASDGE